jgi:uncharacterized lipoprotein YddW (UPF0748 family)
VGLFCLLFICYTDFKGIWIPRWSIDDKGKIFSYIDDEFNHVFLQVFALGETYYPSKYAPSKRNSDKWLRDFLAEAHRREIKVSAWLNVFYSWGYAPKTYNMKHPINKNPNWFVHDRLGKSIIDYSINELRKIGVEGYYLAPANIQVQDYIYKIIEELLTKYDFDGIHLDYIRYPSSQFIYDISLRTEFMREYYFDPQELLTGGDYRTRLSLWGYNDLENKWRRFFSTNLSNFIKDLYKKVKKIERDVQISVAVKPNFLTARNEYGQDWVTWLNSGCVDFVCLMAYNKNIAGCLNRILKVVKEPHRVTVGLGIYALRPDQIKRQVELIRKLPFAGIVFFSYDALKKNHTYLYTLE